MNNPTASGPSETEDDDEIEDGPFYCPDGNPPCDECVDEWRELFFSRD